MSISAEALPSDAEESTTITDRHGLGGDNVCAPSGGAMHQDRSDNELIGEVLVRYATGIDTKDWTLFESCFTDDVHADYGDIGVWNGVDEITEYMTTTHARMPRTNHMMSNFSIEVDGDHASARSYVHVVLVLAEDPLMWIDGVGQYADQLVRADDGWRIRDRKYSTSRLIASDPALLEQSG